MGPGVHEWPFRFDIPGDLDESVEGLTSSYIIYELRAFVDRGYMSKDLATKKHIRIIRTLGRDIMESVPIEQVSHLPAILRLWLLHVPPANRE
jgi:arrestin-related trafficking adapter 4/5/7